MGVPKFYRWISERYPCLSEVVKEYQVPEFDNLYLDMNGIIHVCSHPNDDDPHFRITEEQIFKDIFHYIEVLFRIVRPKKVFFMAVDGVAPRAKMNQQRGRRFRSAKEAEENIKKALKKGETLPDAKRFDSNCITPGTKFMVRLQEQLEYMVKSKVTTDPAWQGIRIFLSGHETPGEGEHKITEFIRHERMQPDYDANTRHCLYGLDADLMMLGLCSHEPHFSLLREEVRFTGKKNKNARTPKPEETTFHLLHLSLMREYIDHEFESLKNVLPFKYDLEAIIDDWVLMGFLVGNDFIPHLPHLHIAHNALPMLYKTYVEVLPTLDGYLNEGGVVHLQRFGKYLEKLSKHDLDKFEEHYADFKWLESKTGKKKSGKPQRAGAQASSKLKAAMNELDSFSSLDGDESTDGSSREQVLEMKSIKVVTELSQRQGLMSPNSEVDSQGDPEEHSTFDIEFKIFKRSYYQEKLHFQGTDGEVAKIAFEYVLAIQWICHYYYNGVQSWSWYYPYHYAPFLSDLRNLSEMKLKYDMGIPFMPYQQLLAVLPAASKECLPEPFWELMCSERSPIIDYYPVDFTCDLNGKQQEWEAVVLIPFINENRLIEAMEPPIGKLKKDEGERNRHSGCHEYTYDNNLDYKVKTSLEGTFPNIEHCKAKLDVIPLHSWSTAEISQFVKGVLAGCRLSVYYPGFPTLYHLPFKVSLKKQGVKVFQMPSRNENTILTILSPDNATNPKDSENQPYKAGESLDDVAKNLLGSSIFVNWPHMEEAKVVAITDGSVKYEVTEHIHATGKGSKHKMQRKTLSKEDNRVFRQDCESVAESYISRRGIDVGETEFIVYAQPLLGRKYICGMQGQITLEKQWSTKPNSYALQATVKDISVKDPTFQQFKGIDELYPEGSTVFMLGHPYYGCQGKVLGVKQSMTSIEFETPCEPDIDSVIRQRQRLSTSYYPGWELGSRVGVSNYLISRITGTIFVFYPANRKWQIGLNLRFSRESSGVAGYTKLGEKRTWKYSEAVEYVLREYMEKFPEILTYLQSALQKQESEFDAAKMTKQSEEADIIAKLQELSTWLKSLDCYHGDKVNENSDMLERKVVNAVVEKLEDCKKKNLVKPVQITIRPHVLYRPLAHQGTLIPDKSTQHRLLDRIVSVRNGYTVPLGLRGTIIGVHKQPGQDVLFDVIFDEEFLGGLEFGGRCPKRRGYRMPECAMINLSHGGRISSKDHKPTAVVRPQNKQFNKQNWQSQNPNTYQRDQRPHSAREHSPRHNRPNNDRQQQREVQRPVSIQQRPASRTVMQRPSTNTVQSSRNQPVSKGQSSTQQSSANMYDTLWNTLKEQNKKPNNVESRTKTATRPKTIPNTKHITESNSVPTITPPQVEKSKQHTNVKSDGNDPISTNTLTSLTQAAKSLPKVNTVSQSPESKTDEKLENEAKVSTTEAKGAKLQQTLTALTTTVTQSQAKPNSGNEGVDHLNNLFNSIKVSQPQAPTFAPRFAFNPRHLSPHNQSSPNRRAPQPNYPPMPFQSRATPFMHRNGTYMWSRPNFNQPPPFYQGQEYHPNPQNFPGYPGEFGNRPMTRSHPMMSPQDQSFMQWPGYNEWAQRQPHPQSMMGRNFTEGTQKLCEMLLDENEDASSTTWSKGEEEDDIFKETKEENAKRENEDKTDDIVNKVDNISMKDEASSSDGDSVKDDEEYMERSTSVEDEKTVIIKKQTKVDELISLCQKFKMMPPIYTYFTTGDEQVVSTVQLWNGVRFSSHPQITRDKAMEEAAGQAIGYLKTEQKDNRPVSTSPPSTLPYYFPVQSIVQPQYYQTHPAYATPVTYSTVPPQTYFLPSVPYAMVQQPVVSSIPTDYQQQGVMMQQQYAIDPQGQYNPCFHQYSPLVRVQVSPTHRAKSASPVYHSATVGKGAWSNQYQIRDKANVSRKTTEFKLLDEPPISVQSKEDQTRRSSSLKGQTVHSDSKQSASKKNASTALPKKQNTAKPKLAISFNKAQTEE